MFGNHSQKGYTEIAKGIRIKTLVYGKNMLMTEFQMNQGAALPGHAHPHEQTGYLVKGCIKLYIGEQSQMLKQGDSWSIPSDVAHKAEIIEDSVAIEVFQPVREDYLKYVNENDIR
jgi:quercetin dioxygenase-like cupin family protein